MFVSSSCKRGGVAEAEIPARPVAVTADGGGGTVPHGNHDPKYGGVVLMNGDVHFEVVLRRDGRHQVYFSDAVRDELPASFASGVTVTVMRAGGPPETVPLQIDEGGESWIGHGMPVDDPAQTMVRVSYTAQGTPHWIDVPFK